MPDIETITAEQFDAAGHRTRTLARLNVAWSFAPKLTLAQLVTAVAAATASQGADLAHLSDTELVDAAIEHAVESRMTSVERY